MNSRRREILQTGSGMTLLAMLGATGWLLPRDAVAADAWNAAAFDTRSMDDTMKALGGGTPVPSNAITFVQTPDIAENGAVVPVGIASAIPNTQAIAILIEKNPNMLAAVFDIPAGTDPSISTRVKMAQTSNIVALVKADGKYFYAAKDVKVTLGGCGG